MTGILLASVGGSYRSKPVNTSPPVVTGTAQVRQTLSCSTGVWPASPPVSSYAYQWKANGTPISGATSNTYNISYLYVGQSISCDVTATNSAGSTTASSNSTAAVAANVPAAPTIGTATATGSTTATVSYTAPTDNGGATITSYTATSSPGGLTGTLNTAGSGTITVSGLSPSTSYTFRVYATNSVGNSAQSNASNSITTQEAFWVMTSNATGYGNGGIGIDSTGVTATHNGYVAPNGAAGLYRVNPATGAILWVKDYGGGSFGNTSPGSSDSTTPQVLSNGSTITSATFMATGQDNIVYQLNTSGGLGNQWQYNITSGNESNAGYVGSVATDGSNFYFGGRITSVGPFMVKINSSGTVQWGKRYTGNNGGGSGVTTAVVAPNGNIYAATQGLAVFNPSTGALNWSRTYSGTDIWGVGADASSGIYGCGFSTYNSTYGPFFGKFDINSPYSCLWGIQLTNAGGQYPLRGIARDPSGNMYFSGSYYYFSGSAIQAAVIVKTNTSGSVLWARQFRVVTGGNSSVVMRDIAINSTGTAFFMAGYGPGNQKMMLKLPTDGSKTGTYGSFVYESFPFGISSLVPTDASFNSTTFDTTNSVTSISMPTTDYTPSQTVTTL